jgi:hypothetical protein
MPDRDHYSYHIMDHLDVVVSMQCMKTFPEKRGPVDDFKIPARDILKSRDKAAISAAS